MAYVSAPEDLVLHGPRVLGFAPSSRIAARFGLETHVVEELLQDDEARGWVLRASFAGNSGWFLTERGRGENERRLAVELDRSGFRDVVVSVHEEFVPLNQRFGQACTNWQIRPSAADRLAANDHTDRRWDERTLRTLAAVAIGLRQLGDRLAGALQRFEGYPDRYAAALAKVAAGDRRWLDGPDVDSCHTVWIQLHEDLLATLGIRRGTDG